MGPRFFQPGSVVEWDSVFDSLFDFFAGEVPLSKLKGMGFVGALFLHLSPCVLLLMDLSESSLFLWCGAAGLSKLKGLTIVGPWFFHVF